MTDEQRRESIRAALDAAIAAGREVTLVVKLESGRLHEVRGVPTDWYKGRDGRARLGLLVGVQTQQAVLLESIEKVNVEGE